MRVDGGVIFAVVAIVIGIVIAVTSGNVLVGLGIAAAGAAHLA